MEAKVTSMAFGSSSSKLDSWMHCATCGIHKSWTPRRWKCDVCQDYFLCENCYTGSLDNSEVLSAPPQVHCQDHPMSIDVTISKCAGCGTNPIWHLRWHCKVCKDFDLCEACYGGLDATDMPLGHSKEHPMIAIEVICSEMLLKLQPIFTKPMDPQWSYEVSEYSQQYGFMWRKRKPMLRILSGMDDAIVCTQDDAIEHNSVSISKLKEKREPMSGAFIGMDEASQANQAYGMLDKKHKVFLSYARTERDFVEQLYQDLLRVDHSVLFFDKDDESQPKGESFPKRIFDAAKHCELAIVVISHEYFIQKWPMLELVAFVEVQKRRPELKILPIFYRLSAKEFREQQMLSVHNWIEKGLVSKDEWKEALQVFSRTNGLEYDKRIGEVGFRARIVEVVNKWVKQETMWDDSHVEGKSRMQEMIREMIQLSGNGTGEVLMVSTLLIGLFGMGGLGKTTMCKVLQNQMLPHFLGRVHHMEFGCVDILHMRVKLLQRICQFESSFLHTLDEGQALTLLKSHIPKQRVCLLIDNVSCNRSCIEEAKMILNLPFKEGSLIVVTSRSSGILETLKIEKRFMMKIPSLTREEAETLFSNHAHCDTSSLTEEEMKVMKSFVEQCNFRSQGFNTSEYHPLALKVLGSQMGPNAKKWRISRIHFKDYGDEYAHPIFSILRSSFDTLNLKYQRIFLDIALYSNNYNVDLSIAGFKRQLRCLYDEVDEQFYHHVLEVLQVASLLIVESNIIYVHDLYREFARMEVEKKGLQHSSRCCFYRGSKRHHIVQEGRVRIHDDPISHISKDILSCPICSEVELLNIEDCANLVGVDVPGMENLRMFHVIGGCPQLTRVNLEGAVNLRSFFWGKFEGKFYPNLTSMESLEELWLGNDEAQSLVTLNGCLDFSNCSNLKQLWLSYLPLNLLNLNQAVLLKKLLLENCQHLERFEGLEALVHLENLWLRACSSLVEFPSLANFPSLEVFCLEGAAKLKHIQGIANLTALRCFSLKGGMELEEVPGIEACTRLSELCLSCTSITRIPDLSSLTRLKVLDVARCKLLTKMDNIKSLPALEELLVHGCTSLLTLPDLWSSMGLMKLHLFNCPLVDPNAVKLPNASSIDMDMEDAVDVNDNELDIDVDVQECKDKTSEALWVHGCTSLLALPDLWSSMGLIKLHLFDCPLVDPNAMKLPNASSIDTDIEDAVDVNDSELEMDVDAQECKDETSALADFQAPNAVELPSSSTTVLEDQRHEVDMPVDVDNVEFHDAVADFQAPNAVELPSSSTTVLEDQRHEVDMPVDVDNVEFHDAVADFQAPNAVELPSSSTTVLEDQRHEVDMPVDVNDVEFQVEKSVLGQTGRPNLIGDKLQIDLTKDLLGVSSTGYVIRTSCYGTEGRTQPCALKRIDAMDSNGSDLARLNHPHVVQLIDHWIEEKFLFLIMELMDGDLAKLMAKTKKPRASPFTLHVTVDLMLQIALGMRHLHEMGVSHPHLKCENVLYRAVIKAEAYQVGDVLVKLGGFGWSRPADVHSKNRDVVCFGQTCLEILTGNANSEMVSKSSIPETTPVVLKDCIVSCLDTHTTFSNVVEELLRAKSHILQFCKDETICSSEIIQTQSAPPKTGASLDETFTVHQLHPQSGDASTSIRATLVFFHGFHKVPEEWRRTWMTRDNKLVWPQTWLPEDLGSQSIRVLSVSFDANSNVSNKYDRHEIGKNLVERLILSPRWKLGEIGEAIFLIGHSFGGVLIKSFVTEAQKNSQEQTECMKFLKNLAEVVLYSVPHAAARAAEEFEDYISVCRKVVPLQRSSFLQSLREDTDFIADMCKLSVDFEEALPENVKVLAFLEGKPMSMRRVLVTEKSCEGPSRPWEWHKVDKDNHFEVSRPESKNHIGYKILLDHLRQCMI